MDLPTPRHDPKDEQRLITYEPPPGYHKHPSLTSTYSGSRHGVSVQAAMHECVNLQEVIREVKLCRDYDDSRSITAILRIAREQGKARSPYIGAPWGTGVYLLLGAALGLASPYTSLGLPLTVIGLIFWLMGFVYAVTWIKHAQALAQFRHEKAVIEVVVTEAIQALVERQRMPKRLYRDDVRMLRQLQARNKWFRPIAQEVLDRADR